VDIQWQIQQWIYNTADTVADTPWQIYIVTDIQPDIQYQVRIHVHNGGYTEVVQDTQHDLHSGGYTAADTQQQIHTGR